MNEHTINIKKLDEYAIMPQYQSDKASGFDIPSMCHYALMPDETKLIRTGFAVELPPGTELQIRPRSGLAAKMPGYISNSPGTVDEDYRGEVMVMVRNTSNAVWTIKPGDRIAQGVVAPVLRMRIVEVYKLSETDRGEGGFGSTGV